LTNTQIKKLLSAFKPYQTMRVRILLALGTGLRRGDIESLSISDIDFENSYITTRSSKTRKSMGSQPVPVPIINELKKYVSGLDPQQENLFTDCFKQDGTRYVKSLVWVIINFTIYVRPLALRLLRMAFPRLLFRNYWSTLLRI